MPADHFVDQVAGCSPTQESDTARQFTLDSTKRLPTPAQGVTGMPVFHNQAITQAELALDVIHDGPSGIDQSIPVDDGRPHFFAIRLYALHLDPDVSFADPVPLGVDLFSTTEVEGDVGERGMLMVTACLAS